MLVFPKFLNFLPDNTFLSIEVNQRGRIDAKPKYIAHVLIPSSNKKFDYYRLLAYYFKDNTNLIYRESVEVALRYRPRPARLDALFIYKNELIFTLDAILRNADIPKSRRYWDYIINYCDEINIFNIILIAKSNYIKKIDIENWPRPIQLVEIA